MSLHQAETRAREQWADSSSSLSPRHLLQLSGLQTRLLAPTYPETHSTALTMLVPSSCFGPVHTGGPRLVPGPGSSSMDSLFDPFPPQSLLNEIIRAVAATGQPQLIKEEGTSLN